MTQSNPSTTDKEEQSGVMRYIVSGLSLLGAVAYTLLAVTDVTFDNPVADQLGLKSVYGTTDFLYLAITMYVMSLVGYHVGRKYDQIDWENTDALSIREFWLGEK